MYNSVFKVVFKGFNSLTHNLRKNIFNNLSIKLIIFTITSPLTLTIYDGLHVKFVSHIRDDTFSISTSSLVQLEILSDITYKKRLR